ncbi:MAG: cation-transporting P-type ATPase, partial [Syntrophobacteraceae bacterium]
METHSFRIKGMCCGEEVGLLKSEVAPLIGGDERLSFDLLRSRMTIVGSLDPNVVERIRTAVARTGMEAVPSEEGCSAGVCAAEVESTWEKHGRLFSCLASGFFLLAAFIAQAIPQGNILAPLAGESAAGAPIFTVVLYLASILAGAWQVFPKALYAARKLRPDMNLLMTVAVL